jgi:peptidylprolyl isomerase
VRRLFVLAALGVASVALVGCGGSANPTSSVKAASTPLKLTIDWAARSRVLNAPASALSAVVSFGTVNFPAVDRNDAAAAYSQSYVSPNSVPTGPGILTVTFYAEKNGKGAVVGNAAKTINLAADGSGAGDVLLVGKIQSIVLTAAARLAVGASQTLGFSATDGAGRTVAISPGSVVFTQKNGATSLTLADAGQVTGLAVGSSELTVSLDSLISPIFKIDVTAPTGATAVIAAGQGVVVGESRKLSYSITDASGNPIAFDPARLTFEVTSGSDVVSLAPDGTITGAKIGQAQVKVKIPGLESTPQTIVVRPVGTTINLAISEQQNVKLGEAKKLSFTATDASGNALPLATNGVTYTVTQGSDKLSIDSEGNLVAKAAGYAVVTITVNGVTSAPQSVLVGEVISTVSGLKYIELTVGTGKQPQPRGNVTLHYTGTLLSGFKFDSSRDRGTPSTFNLDGVIKGFGEGVSTMKIGGRRLLIIPSNLGYGATGSPPNIPGGATLLFDCELFEVNP